MKREGQSRVLRSSRTRRRASAAHLLLLGPALAAGLLCCSPAKPVAEAQYATAIVGEWQGTVGDEKESISFAAGGAFNAQLSERGFISNTLSQGVTGTIQGTWAIAGKVITLTITSAEDARAQNGATASTIEAMSQNEVSMRSERGETSVFLRVESL